MFAPVKPYVFLVVDTSGSMTHRTAFGVPGCPGAADTKLDHAKCAIDTLANDFGDVLRWNDFTCGTCGNAIASNPEIFAGGFTPIAGSLNGVQRYFQGLQVTDGTVLWPSDQPGFDPIRTDPLGTTFLPSGQQCRPYVVVSLTDGEETCATFAETTAAAAALLTTTVDGRLQAGRDARRGGRADRLRLLARRRAAVDRRHPRAGRRRLRDRRCAALHEAGVAPRLCGGDADGVSRRRGRDRRRPDLSRGRGLLRQRTGDGSRQRDARLGARLHAGLLL